MSRYYEMDILISHVPTDKTAVVSQIINGLWDIDNEEEPFEDSEGVLHLRFVGRGNLCSGEGEDDFAQRVAEKVWCGIGQYCKVKVIATYLENIPYEEYEFGEEEYAEFAKIGEEE